MTETDRVGTTNDETYTYDTNGNRTNAGYATRADNRLRSDGTYTYRYDNEGNLTSQIGAGLIREFTWDYRNRLTKVVDKNASGLVTKSVDYTYDALNQRLAKAVDPDGAGAQAATVTRFIYDRDHVALEFTGSTPTRYFYGTGVDQILAMDKANQTTWLLTDHLGSVRQGVDNAGTVTGSLEYNSFGQVVSQTGAVSDWRYRYTGREFDSETGLYYYRARYYDAGVGRFIGQDPLGFDAGDINLYRYVKNDTPNRIDPSGTRDMRWPWNGSVKNESSQPVIILNSNRIGDILETLRPGDSTPDQPKRSKDVDGVWVYSKCDRKWLFFEIYVGKIEAKLTSVDMPMTVGKGSVPLPMIMPNLLLGDVVVKDNGVYDRVGGRLPPGQPGNRGKQSPPPGSPSESINDVAGRYLDASIWRRVRPGDEERENHFER